MDEAKSTPLSFVRSSSCIKISGEITYKVNLTYEIDLESRETLTLPKSLVDQIVEGIWIITIQSKSKETGKIRNHNGFLNGYVPEDEGLYDDYPIG